VLKENLEINMKKIPLYARIIITIIVMLLLIFFGLFVFIAANFIVRPYINIFFQNIAWLIPSMIGAFMLIKFYFDFNPKKVFRVYLVLIGLILIGFSSVFIYENHLEKIRIVDRGINLYDYMPFQDESKIARLNEEANLRLSDQLPRLDGATALYPVYAAFVEAVYPRGTYNPYDYSSYVTSMQTSTAYERLIYGEVDVIFVAGPSYEHLLLAEQQGVELNLIPIGREAFVFFVNASNPVDNLSLDDIRHIYSGAITNWSDVGGLNAQIQAFQRPVGSGSQTALIKLMGDMPLMDAPEEFMVGGMGGIISSTANYRNHRHALGYSFRYYSTELVQNKEIKHLAINGVFPTVESIRDGSYPITSSFYAVTAHHTNPHLDDFIAWILSEQGQYLIEASGYVPINN
jgi:phosphate transport system substrate-binding protein